MGSQQFCLKWNNHQSNMLAVFEQLLSNEALVDVTLACEGLSLKAHKMVLSACSPFFQALFVENPCKHPIVILKDMRYMDLKAIVEFMYRGEVNVSQDHLTALLKTAETLKVKGLAEVTNENKHGGLVTSVDGAADAKPVGTPRAESPPLSKRKRGRPRRRSPSDSNKSDSEDAPPATRIKGPESPEIIEDGSLSSDRVTNLPAASPSSRTSNVAASSSAVPSGARLTSSVQATTSQHTQDSIGDDVGEGDDADFDVEPLNVMEQSMTTENVPVFPDVASSSQALGDESQQSHHTGSTSDNSALVPVHPSLPSDISITSQVDIKPSPSSLIPYDDQTISPVVAASPAAALSGDGASTAMVMDASGVPAIAGPSSYQQSTPSHGFQSWLPSQQLSRSLVSVRGRVRSCRLCTYVTTASSSMTTHLRTHTGERPFRCHLCPSAFAQSANLKRHVRTHTGERPFTCGHCAACFTQKSDLRSHMRLHTGEKPYRCSRCFRLFRTQSQRASHFKDCRGAFRAVQLNPVLQPQQEPELAMEHLLPDRLPPDGLLPNSLPTNSLLPNSLPPDNMLPEGLSLDGLPPDNLSHDSLPAGSMSPDILSPDSLQPETLPPQACSSPSPPAAEPGSLESPPNSPSQSPPSLLSP